MKWLFFALSIAIIFPLAAWLRRNPEQFRIVWFVFGFLPFGLTLSPLFGIALINWAGWPGYAKGALFLALDAAVLAICLSQPRSQNSLPFLKPMLLYFGVVLLSVLLARIPMAAMFYPWQLLRVFLLYLVVARASADRAVIFPLLAGLTAGLCLEAGIMGYQRIVLGELQPNGSFGHQNQLGIVANLILLPLFALLLSGRTGWIGLVGPVAGCIVVVLTTSRATVGLAAVGLAALFLVSVVRQRTAWKARMGLVGAVALALLAPIAITSFEARFAKAPIEIVGGYDERVAFIEAARRMLEDHPLGVGVNNFVLVANVDGYFDRAGVTWVRTSRGAHVHNVYWLAAAETGYLGLAALLLLMFVPLKAALTCGWRHREDRRGDLLLGLGVSLMVLYVHCYYEWIFFTSTVQYMLAINFGLIAGLTQQLGYWRKAERGGEASPLETSVLAGAGAGDIDPAVREQDDVLWGIARLDSAHAGSDLSKGEAH